MVGELRWWKTVEESAPLERLRSSVPVFCTSFSADQHLEENDFEPVDDMLPDEREVVQVAHRGSFRDFTQAVLDQVVHIHTQMSMGSI